MASDRSGIDQLVETLSSISDEELEKMARMIRKVLDNMDALMEAMEILRLMKENGILDAVARLFGGLEEGFNAMAKPDMMKPMANAMMLLYMLSNVSYETLFDLAETMPRCMGEAMKKMRETRKGYGIVQLLRIMRSPEMAALINAMVGLSSCMKETSG